jgi:16S rRNA (cytosine967-C5)-methyltransferase
MVDFIRELEGDAPARFANAILRRLAEQGAQWREAPYPSRASPQEQALWASLPDWMMKEFLKNYGEEWTRGYALASLERPDLWIRHRERGAEKVETLPPLKQRDFFVQDISSQVLVDRVSAFLKDRKLKTVLDFCSAPGGKAMGLVWNGFDVTATDENSSRLKRVIENRERLQMDSLQIQNMDEIERHHEKWDAVWVDAPCTGSGILRRHPEIRWTRSAQDFQALQKLQVEILRKASQHIHPGGVLIYSVCSVLKAEGAEQIRKWLGETAPGIEYTLFPQLEPHGDGFYLALVSMR